MILLDSNVVIDYSRGNDPKLLTLFAALPLAVCGIVRAEVLAGARSLTDRNKLIGLLASMSQVPIVDPLWDTVGDNLELLRANGITVPLPTWFWRHLPSAMPASFGRAIRILH